jgi:serine protease AprX
MTIWSFILTALCLLTYPEKLSLRAENVADDTHQYYYRIWFTDKGDRDVGDFATDHLLSPAAIARRAKNDVIALTLSDLPVNEDYINTIVHEGLTFKYSSKWMNTALFTCPTVVDITMLEELPFVKSVTLVKHPSEPVKHVGAKYGITQPAAITDSFDPNIPLNGTPLHQSDFTGRNVIIAVLDVGFINADLIESLAPLRERGGIIATRDFVSDASNVYAYHSHGTSVLTILAGSLPGVISGTAPDADYLLLRTEDAASEYPVEEDYWVAAAEYADSAGADIITSSLGYFLFDDPEMDYSFSDMDGNTTFITRAADAAASKGILVVASAGNERDKQWIRIMSPSDGDSVMCVGAVNQNLTISDFSSAGYSYDGRVKPDVVAPGVNLLIQNEPDQWQTGSGTSFSCPVISGLCASLMQAVPDATAAEVMDAVRASADRFNSPDSLYGYGLPDFVSALKRLEDVHTFRPEVIMSAGPNPFYDEIHLWFSDVPGHLTVRVADNSGRTILIRDYRVYASRSYTVDGFGTTGQGIFYVRVITDQGETTFKMIRLRR